MIPLLEQTCESIVHLTEVLMCKMNPGLKSFCEAFSKTKNCLKAKVLS